MAITWAEYSRPTSTRIRRAICVGSGKFIAVGDSGTVATSSDSGQTWTARTASSANTWAGLAYDGTTVISIASSGAGTRVMLSTDDGATWAAATTVPQANNWGNVCSTAAGTFVAVSSNGVSRVMRSTDSGVTWTAIAASSALTWGGLAFNGTLLVAKANEDTMVSSDGGLTWTTYTAACPAINGLANAVFYSSVLGQFVVAGYNGSNQGVLYGSVDGQTWTLLSTVTTHIFAGLVVADSFGGFLVATPFTSAFASTPSLVGWSDDDGANWTIDDTTFSPDANGWEPGAWDPATSTAVFFNHSGTNVLVGTAPSAEVLSISPAFGTRRGDTVVTITGLGFTGATSATVGGLALLSFSVVNDTTITGITKAHAVGAVDVVVTGVGTLTNGYTYVSVDRVSPKTGTVAGSTAVTITGFGFAAASSVLFDDLEATSVVVVSNLKITAVTPAHEAGRIDVEVVGVDTGEGLYTYTLPVPQTLGKMPLLPPIPTRRQP